MQNIEYLTCYQRNNSRSSKKLYEFVGPVCETTDKFVNIKKIFRVLKENDIIALFAM